MITRVPDSEPDWQPAAFAVEEVASSDESLPHPAATRAAEAVSATIRLRARRWPRAARVVVARVVAAIGEAPRCVVLPGRPCSVSRALRTQVRVTYGLSTSGHALSRHALSGRPAHTVASTERTSASISGPVNTSAEQVTSTTSRSWPRESRSTRASTVTAYSAPRSSAGRVRVHAASDAGCQSACPPGTDCPPSTIVPR